MSKLEKLIKQCSGSVYLTINQHKNDYSSAEYCMDHKDGRSCPPDIAPGVRRKMIELDSIICCQFYPVTPVGSYEVWHYDLDKCLDECLSCFNKGVSGV